MKSTFTHGVYSLVLGAFLLSGVAFSDPSTDELNDPGAPSETGITIQPKVKAKAGIIKGVGGFVEDGDVKKPTDPFGKTKNEMTRRPPDPLEKKGMKSSTLSDGPVDKTKRVSTKMPVDPYERNVNESRMMPPDPLGKNVNESLKMPPDPLGSSHQEDPMLPDDPLE